MKKHDSISTVHKNSPANFECLRRLALPVLLVLLLFGSAKGLTISMTDVGPTAMTTEQLNAFTEAAEIWEDRFTDPVTVYINISIEPLDWNILGSTSIARTTHSYTSVRTAMLADAVLTSENSIVSSLPLGSVNIEDINGNRADSSVTMATANAKALGLGTGPDGTYAAIPVGVDAEIGFATAYVGDFDYDRTDGIGLDKIDFVVIRLTSWTPRSATVNSSISRRMIFMRWTISVGTGGSSSSTHSLSGKCWSHGSSFENFPIYPHSARYSTNFRRLRPRRL